VFTLAPDPVSGQSVTQRGVKADNDGEICCYTFQPVHLIIDVNAVSFDVGITSFPNQRNRYPVGLDHAGDRDGGQAADPGGLDRQLPPGPATVGPRAR
jgi:hypothetical protein